MKEVLPSQFGGLKILTSPATFVSMQNETKIIVDYLLQMLPGVQAIYLFGSRATDEARPDSDFDIAFLNPQPVSDFFQKHEMMFGLAKKLGAEKVDLVDLKTADDVLRFEVVARGKCLFAANKTQVAFFEMQVISDFQRLQEEQKDLLDAIQKRGFVYG